MCCTDWNHSHSHRWRRMMRQKSTIISYCDRECSISSVSDILFNVFVCEQLAEHAYIYVDVSKEICKCFCIHIELLKNINYIIIMSITYIRSIHKSNLNNKWQFVKILWYFTLQFARCRRKLLILDCGVKPTYINSIVDTLADTILLPGISTY